MTKEFLPTAYDERWAQAASEFADLEPVSGSLYMSTRGGRFTLGDEDLGDEICVVVAGAIRENTVYAEKFEPGVKQAPVCYAFGVTEAEMAPHPSMAEYPDVFVPQADDCASCPLNKWGSAEVGRGKACQNKRRLGLIPAGYYHPARRRGEPSELEVYTDEKHYIDSDLVTLKLPVTSVKEWAKYVKKLADTVRRPPYGVLTRMYTVPDKDDQYHVKFELIDLLPDELIDVVTRRHEAAMESLPVPYKPCEGDDEQRSRRDDRGAPQRSRPTLRR